MDIKLDDVQLMFGDCLERLKELPDGSIDLILTDPPYGTTACKWDTVIDLPSMWGQVWRVLKPNGACVLFGSQPFTSILGASQTHFLKYSWVWIKSRPSGFLNVKKQPMKGFEEILVFYKRPPTYNPQGVVRVDKVRKNSKSNSIRTENTSTLSGTLSGEYHQEFSNYPRAVLEFASVTDRQHPTQKPVPLLEYLIKTYTVEGETVLDFTMGSGSTGVACVNTDRKFVGIELDANYFGIASKRVLDAMGDQLFKGVS